MHEMIVNEWKTVNQETNLTLKICNVDDQSYYLPVAVLAVIDDGGSGKRPSTQWQINDLMIGALLSFF